MTWCLILVCIALAIFIAYNATMFGLFGPLASLSNTYYYMNNRWPHSGWVFTAMMWIVFGMIMPAWLEVNQIISEWSQYLTILPFASAACLLFVATAPNFRDGGLPETVHMTCAKLAAVFSLLWFCIVCWKIMYIFPICTGLCWLIAWLTGTMKSMRDWWWEMCAFSTIFAGLITETILHL